MSDSLSSCPGAIGGGSPSIQAPNVKDDFRWARFFRELAGILVLHLNIPGQAWVGLLKRVGSSQVDIDDLIHQDLDPEIQAYKLLNKSRTNQQSTVEWWSIFRREVTAQGNQNLTKEVERAYEKFITGEVVDSSDSDKSLPPPQDASSPTQSPTPPPIVPKSNQSFEVINEDEVVKSSEEIKSKLKEEINVEISNPEVSQQIDNVRRVIQEVAGKSPQLHVAVQLAEAVTQILQMENSYRATQTLKDILERENEFNKKERVRQTQELEAASHEIQALRQENEELKKTNADKNLSGFDVITKKEAHECAETKETVLPATKGAPEGDMVNISAYHDLQARCIKVTKQRDQLIKVNHQWDTEYHNMEKALRSENQKIYQDVIAKDEEIMAGKRLIADLEKEKTEAVGMATKTVGEYDRLKKKYEGEKGKCRKYHEYAQRLSQQKEKLEQEIARLNTVLSQEKQKTSRKAAPTGEDFQNEIALYKQQAEIFEKDFRDEHREKRRLVGELEATKEELEKVKGKLRKSTAQSNDQSIKKVMMEVESNRVALEQRAEKCKKETDQTKNEFRTLELKPAAVQSEEKAQMNEDERIARQLQAGGQIFRERRPREPLPAPRGVNYAGNDRWVDAPLISSFGSIEADGVDGGARTPPGERAPNQCPRCEAFIEDEDAFMNHLGRCLDEE